MGGGKLVLVLVLRFLVRFVMGGEGEEGVIGLCIGSVSVRRRGAASW